MSTVVITGARGYIGTALAKRLADEGYSLRLVSRPSDIPRIESANAARIEYIEADLRDERVWSGLMSGAGAIVHLSSRTDLRAAEADPSGDGRINIDPVRALVKASAGAAAPPRVIFASTVTIVGVGPALPVDEKTPDEPCSVYDRHKLACESILRKAAGRGLVRSCSLRLSNVYGYGGTSLNANRGILNVMLKRAAEGEPLTLYGDGSYVRDFTHLDDVVDAFCRAISTDRAGDGGHYVIAKGRGCDLAEAYELVAAEAFRQIGRRVEIRHVPEPEDLQPIERRNFVGDSSSFQQLTGWRPIFDLQAGIRDYFARVASCAAIGGGASGFRKQAAGRSVAPEVALQDVSIARLIELPCFQREDGDLVVAETAAQVPFPIARMFTLRAPAGAQRGQHAHRLCSQFMICVSGAVDVVCDDGREQRTFTLDRGSVALLVPPTIWSTVIFRDKGSVVAVLCDRPYEENDYIRDSAAFLAYRTAPRS